ncbi:hypothetical protein [Mycolicibacterium sp. J2]|uniref:hypothetical protein n=1 Tax=Mycolicibacterium sp. J2 TaxID=2993511 RepID=UPI00224AC261|nr:hypothetical protein [Mycolicibacterium sp. J2]MCX2716046.1 hypothetical protein [Mycolicibacterium sp. J2]
MMFGISADEDFDFLVGKLLQQMCFGENELVLRFDDPTIDLKVVSDVPQIVCVIESNIEIITQVRGSRLAESALSLAGDLVNLLGKRILGVETKPRTLSLKFDNEYTLVLHDSEEHYESFNIRYGDGTIVV